MSSNLFEEYNNVILQGKIVTEKKFNHEIYGEKFYVFDLEVARLSNVMDVIPILISERLLIDNDIKVGTLLNVNGQYRSYNSSDQTKNRLVLMVFVKEYNVINEINVSIPQNEITLNGFLCKKPVYRTTPLGRDIVDILLAVNRAYNKSDYIPLIAWGRNAKYSKDLIVGTNIKVVGRIQSRQYEKKYEDGTTQIKRAYEVSVDKLELID